MKECRYCLSTENFENLIIPCKCEGSLKYVHQSCLKAWVETNKSFYNFDYFFTIPCEFCKYNIRCTRTFENSLFIAFLRSVNSIKNLGMFFLQILMLYVFYMQVGVIAGLFSKLVAKNFKTKYIMRLFNQIPIFFICVWFFCDLFKFYKNIFYENRKPLITFLPIK
jgi:E3 ubiquitin-protein ligase DOA10